MGAGQGFSAADPAGGTLVDMATPADGLATLGDLTCSQRRRPTTPTCWPAAIGRVGVLLSVSAVSRNRRVSHQMRTGFTLRRVGHSGLGKLLISR